jgi:predicted metalloprotease
MAAKRSKPPALALVLVVVVGLLAACGGDSSGPPSTIGGLPLTHFASGLRFAAPDPDLQVRNVTDAQVDQLATSAIADVSTYWSQELPRAFSGQQFAPVKSLLSYDARGENQQNGCGDTKKLVNAFYCTVDDSISWDRGVLLPMLLQRFGPIAVVGVLAHEYGHAIQQRLKDKAGITPGTPVIVKEQQADCFAGSYLRWVAEGNSKFYQVSTADGLGQVLASLFLIRDNAGGSATDRSAHGSAFDRIYAFQRGFEQKSASCAEINAQEISGRITEVPFNPNDPSKGDSPIDAATVTLLQKSLDRAFSGSDAQPPRITAQTGTCPNGPATPPASYCSDTNTVNIDMRTLAVLGQPVDVDAEMAGEPTPGRGDFAAFSEIASRYVQGIQKAVGIPLDDNTAGLRTACLVGAWAKSINQPNVAFRLSPGDLDEAISDLLLPTSLVAADVNGVRVDSSFARVAALRRGYLEGSKTCTDNFN